VLMTPLISWGHWHALARPASRRTARPDSTYVHRTSRLVEEKRATCPNKKLTPWSIFRQLALRLAPYGQLISIRGQGKDFPYKGGTAGPVFSSGFFLESFSIVNFVEHLSNLKCIPAVQVGSSARFLKIDLRERETSEGVVWCLGEAHAG
jgi:hypothetical protein